MESGLEALLSPLWRPEQKAQILKFIQDPRFNGGGTLPDGTDLAAVFDLIPSESFAVWKDDTPSLCLALLPIDTERKTGLFHITGDGRLSSEEIKAFALLWLGMFHQQGYQISGFTKSLAVARWSRTIGFTSLGYREPAGVWVGLYEPGM